MRSSRAFLHCSAVFVALCVFGCSNPTDQEPFRWRWFGEVPLTQRQFFLGEEFKNLFKGISSEASNDSTLKIKGVDDETRGDEVVFSVHQSESDSFLIEHDSLETSRFVDRLGIVTISGFGTKSIPLPLGVTLADTSDSVFFLRFASQSPKLAVTLSNTSAANLTNVRLAIDGLGTDSIDSLAAGTQTVLTFTTAQRQLDSVFAMRLDADGGGASDIVTATFSFNGLQADSLVIVDYLAATTVSFTNYFELTDTVNLHYADITEGKFLYTFTNGTEIDFHLTGVHDNIWGLTACKTRPVESIEQLNRFTSSDSSAHFAGYLTSANQPVTIYAKQVTKFGETDLSSKRIFPTWRDSVSVSRVVYHLASLAKGAVVHLGANDSLSFVLEPINFKLHSFKATLMSAYEQKSDTTYDEIPFPWEDMSKESLREKFFLDSVVAQINVSIDMAEDANLDSFLVNIQLFNPAKTTICSLVTTFTGVKNDTTFSRLLNITKLVNDFPDSIGIHLKSAFPIGSQVMVVTDKSDAAKNAMTVGFTAHLDLDAPIYYHAIDTVPFDLGYQSFKMAGATRIIGKMEEREVSVMTDITNHTNIYIRLFGLMGTGSKRFALDSLPSDSVGKLVRQNGMPDGFINLFGSSGILIPKRGENHKDKIVLNEQQIDAMFNCADCDSAGWRWHLEFLPKLSDKLLDTNYIQVNSKVRIEGIQNSDSLLIWSEE